jgi:hypothetical protein
LWTVCPRWLWTTILLISASWVARITGMSHWHPACDWVLRVFKNMFWICKYFVKYLTCKFYLPVCTLTFHFSL